VLSNNELKSLINLGRESRSIEYKQSYNWSNSEHKAKLTKAILGLSNIKDGGFVILGVEPQTHEPVGMPEEDFNKIDSDALLAHVNNYADPYTDFIVYKYKKENKLFVIIEVFEFELIPVICKKDYTGVLQKGNIYTRPRRIPETAAIPSQTEMREIIDIAIEKGIRNFQIKLSKMGMGIKSNERDSGELFDKELGDL
jgi:predicted HTH transcriptional regulator